MTTPTSTPVVIPAAVAEVLLLEDRAQIWRRVDVELVAGANVLRIEDVTPLVADRTLTVRARGAVRVDEARVRRRWRIGATERPKIAGDLEREEQRIEEAMALGEESMAALDHRRRLLDSAHAMLVQSINRELPYHEDFEPRWEQGFAAIADEKAALDGQWIDRQQQQQALERELEALGLQRSIHARSDDEIATSIELWLTAEAAGRVQLEVTYTVPCALWRPIHRATLRGRALRFECEAAVWQVTGEDWDQARLRFSTARPTQRAEPPVLEDDQLQVRRKTEKVVKVGLRETTIATTGEGAATQGAPELPGVDDGGETRLLEASVRTCIPSDGRMRRIPTFVFEGEAERDHLCCPELSPLVHLRSRQVNTAPHPLLAGPVDLLRDSGYVGRTQIGFVAPGERFALGWGSEDSLRVQRALHEHRDTTRITGKQTIKREIKLSLSNLDASLARFAIQERVPVSEIDKVKVQVEKDETRPPAAPDANGIVSWPVQLPGRDTDHITLVYTLTASSDVEGL